MKTLTHNNRVFFYGTIKKEKYHYKEEIKIFKEYYNINSYNND